MFQRSLFLIFILSSIACSQEKKKIQTFGILNEVLDCQTLDGLKLKYGPKNVVDDTSWVIGDDTLRGSIIFPNSSKQAFVYLHDTNIVDVTIKGESADWKTNSGLYLGMTLTEVQTINAKNFTLSGFNWSHGGSVVSWEGGKLTGDSTLSHLAAFSNVSNEHSGISDEAYKMISGEVEFDVRHPDIQKLNPKLDLISIIIPNIPSKSEGKKIGSHIQKSQVPN
ncbi:MAG: hypothetical protein EBT45_05680 [Alphaproteobacteria bacterium]|nr:hypothetical protein [Alphaproteobacteria bacterium]